MKTRGGPISPIWVETWKITLSEIRDIEIDTYRDVEISGAGVLLDYCADGVYWWLSRRVEKEPFPREGIFL